jgi:hypothetical protein
MTTSRQRKTARKNVRKAKARGRGRLRPGTGGGGQYYRIEVRPYARFVTYRLQNLGRPGHTKRLAGRTARGHWNTKSWLIRKSDAHVEAGKLVIDAAKAKTVLRGIRGPIKHVKGDIFAAKPRRNVPEREKPTPAQRRAYAKNIKRARRTHRR